MIEEKIIDYIKAQVAAGASKEAIKDALVKADWPETDVDDSIKGVLAPSDQKTKTILISDLLAASDLPVMSMAPGVEAKEGGEGGAEKLAGLTKKSVMRTFQKILNGKAGAFNVIILTALLMVSAIAAAFFYFQYQNAKKEIAAMQGVSDAASSKISELNSQIGVLGGQINSLGAKVTTLTAENEKLSGELYFFLTPLGLNATTELTVTLQGVVGGGGRALYAFTTDKGIKVFVKNSKNSKVDALLKVLLGKTAEISGTHLSGSREMTVTAINGASVQ